MKTHQELTKDFNQWRAEITTRLRYKFPRMEITSITFWYIKRDRIQINMSIIIKEYMFIHNLKKLEEELQKITGTMLFKLAFKIEKSKLIIWGFSPNPFL